MSAKSKFKGKGGQQGKGGYRGPQKGGGRPKGNPNPTGGGPANFPYRFQKRSTPDDRALKTAPEAFHDRLTPGRFDIAFEVTWKTLTPTASNPCVDLTASPSNPKNSKDEFTGYNRRWLMFDNRPAISPFTVKSAIANGVANLLGGCYRVIDKEEGHPDKVQEGHYYYKGGYKRYRVAMSDKSSPGILKKIKCESEEGGPWWITVQPVTEYYCDLDLKGIELKKGQQYQVAVKYERHKNFIDSFNPRPGQKTCTVTYYGPYFFGMDRKLKAPDLGKKHLHRFYQENGEQIKGHIPAVNFESVKKLQSKVYMGQFRRLNKWDKRPEGGPWHENLEALKKDPFLYYQSYTDPETGEESITNIGKNYQFKALFFHEDAVPGGFERCRDHTMLCPRCRLFGMTDEDQKGRRDAIGLKGRFKAAALVHPSPLKPVAPSPYQVPGENQTVQLNQWAAEDGMPAAKQVLLPLSGPPKPNKRDVDGYFDITTGQIRGAKVYKHAKLDDAHNLQNVDALPPKKSDDDRDKGYAHRLRNYAMVCRPDLEFSGTLGVENGDMREIAALLLLLNTKLSDHGFKIGLGKAFGMGSASSAVNAVWVRKKDDHGQWRRYRLPDDAAADELKTHLDEAIPGVVREMEAIKNVREFKDRINSLTGRENRNLKYPSPDKNDNPGGKQYWNIFKQSLNV